MSCCNNDDTKKPKESGAAPSKPVEEKEWRNAENRKVAWKRIQARLPRAKTAEDKKRRKELFAEFDKDGSGALSEEEAYWGCIYVLQLDEFTTRLRPITNRAFKKAKGTGTQDRNAGSADKVEFLEFRLMLCYIYDYFELTVMFDEMDKDGNMTLDKKEFVAAAPKLEKWGAKMENPEKTFKELDGNHSGKVTFDEFAAWASAAKLDADGDPDDGIADAKEPVAAAAASRSVPTGEKTADERKTAWEKIRARIPRSKTAEDKKRRKELFKKFDADGSKSLTFEETYQGCISILHLDEFTNRLKDICKRAFNKAKGLGGEIVGKGEDDKVEFREFRLMLCYIYDYFELTVMFDEIDADGSMMLDRDEFKAAVPKLAKWGVKIENYKKTFKEIDDNNSGKVTFDEFAAWASAAKLDADGDPDNVH